MCKSLFKKDLQNWLIKWLFTEGGFANQSVDMQGVRVVVVFFEGVVLEHATANLE